jgi:hypothetical protein
VGSLISHSPIGLHDLLQGQLYFFYIKIKDYEICHKSKDIRGNGDTEKRRLKDDEE